MLKVDLKKNVENSQKLIRTLNRIENRFQIIEKQNANQSIEAKTYANVIKAVTKITKIENKRENTMKKIITVNMTATKKENDVENSEQLRKKELKKNTQ